MREAKTNEERFGSDFELKEVEEDEEDAICEDAELEVSCALQDLTQRLKTFDAKMTRKLKMAETKQSTNGEKEEEEVEEEIENEEEEAKERIPEWSDEEEVETEEEEEEEENDAKRIRIHRKKPKQKKKKTQATAAAAAADQEEWDEQEEKAELRELRQNIALLLENMQEELHVAPVADPKTRWTSKNRDKDTNNNHPPQ